MRIARAALPSLLLSLTAEAEIDERMHGRRMRRRRGPRQQQGPRPRKPETPVDDVGGGDRGGKKEGATPTY